MSNSKTANILVIGGSGHWCEQNHYPAILDLGKQGVKSRVVAICDPINPYSIDHSHFDAGRKYLHEVLKLYNPEWLNPDNYSDQEILEHLNDLVKKEDVNIVIVSNGPIDHYFYVKWALDRGISVLCDKPLVATADAAWRPPQAKLIEEQFQDLLAKVIKNKKKIPNYTFCTPLRRRALTPFLRVAESLSDVYERTGQGITYMNVIVNGGVHRYPIEFLKSGAHGYTQGVGSLSHSSYHYLDLIGWYLQLAPGSAKKIEVSVTHVSRVKDYLARKDSYRLAKLNKEEKHVIETMPKFDNSVLNCELDFTIHLLLKDAQDQPVGLISYTCNHTTFSPRTTKYNPDMLDHANDTNGGRMSQIYFDISQGSFQHWQLVKNDVVFQGNNILANQRLHPLLGKSFEQTFFPDAYDSHTVTPRELLRVFIKKSLGLPVAQELDEQLQQIERQTLSHRIFSASYEQIANDYASRVQKPIVIELS